MSVSTSGGAFPRALLNQDLNNGAPAEGLTLQTLNAGNEWLAAYVGGTRPVSGLPVISPPTPMQGASGGHDHSGGIMGTPQVHTVWHTAYGTVSQADLFNNLAPREKESASLDPVSLIDRWVGPILVPGGVVYTDLEFEALINVETESVGYSLEISHAAAPSYSATQTGTLSTGDNWVTLSDRVLVVPGALQQVRVRLLVTDNGGSSNGVANLYFAALHQTRSS